MDLNADFNARVAVHAETVPWAPSPMPGVDRRMLDRLGDEVARATSIVRYAPGSAFSPHTHGGGEEFIVLEGVFQDEHGDYPVGSYVRNPPRSAHRPASAPGCVIFVKLWQFDPADRAFARVPMDRLEAIPDPARPGVSVSPLYRDALETVRREFWDPGASAEIQPVGGAELFVLDGGFVEAGEAFSRHDWLRLPDGHRTRIIAGPDGIELWIKSGHLRHVRGPSTGG